MRSLSKVLTIAGVALVASAALPASASTAMRFTVRPDAGGSLSPGGDYFVLEAAPGDVVRQALELANPGGRTVVVRLAAVDATTAQFGGVDYSPSEARPSAVGKWIELGAESVTLAPGAVREVPFSVSVPAGAASGVNLGGIAAWTPPRDGGSADAQGLNATAEVQTRRVVAVQVDLPGPAEPALEIDGVRTIARPDGVYLQVDLRNTGNGFAQGEGTIELAGEGFSTDFALDKVVPGTGVGYPVRWRTKAPASGAYPVVVTIDYGADVAEYRGDVVVGGGLGAELADRGIGDAGGDGFPVLPAAVAGAVCCAAAALVWRRRRGGASGAASETPSEPAPVAASPPPPPPPASRNVTPPPPPPPPPVHAARG
ncbi:MAG TPA: DUF916 domain-containing protein [Actinomycetota bacterium]|nr:DUF916 domain-containing protein [Actinomycetota bacterium]